MHKIQKGKCRGCNRDLARPKIRFDWLIARGYDEKDAAAQVLNDPSGTKPVLQCCIVNLQTNIDADAGLLERQIIKDEILADEAAARAAQELPPVIRETVVLYSATETKIPTGQFILRDAEFDDPKLLAPSFKDKALAGSNKEIFGFPITDIAPVPERISKAEGWGKYRPMAFWSGNIKIIPVVTVGDMRRPGIIWLVNPNGDIPLHGGDQENQKLIKSFIGSDVLDYIITPLTFPNIGEIPTHALMLKKQLAKDVFHI